MENMDKKSVEHDVPPVVAKKKWTLDAVLDMLVFPTVELTKESPRKWVRAAGKIGVVVPMLPWTVVAMITVAVTALFEEMGRVCREWWEKV